MMFHSPPEISEDEFLIAWKALRVCGHACRALGNCM